jgi:hypothetical protein
MATNFQRALDTIRDRCAPGPERQRAYVRLARQLAEAQAQAALLQTRHQLNVLTRHARTLARQEREHR